MACHKGGPMGYASSDPLNLLIDYFTMAASMSSSSTSGTSGCENWDIAHLNRLEFLHASWENLSEEASNGKGEHIEALSQMYGCQGDNVQKFGSMMQGNYPHLFKEKGGFKNYERAHLLDTEISRLIKEYYIDVQCIYKSSS